MTEEEYRKALVEEALSWAKTPYHDHSGIKGVGVDCAYILLRIFQNVGLAPKDFKVPHYSPQQWLNSPCQTDRKKLKFEDTTFIDIVIELTKREIQEPEVKPGDIVIYKVAASWTHGGFIVEWPRYVIHPLKGLGVIGSHGTNEGFLVNRPHRFFTVF